MQPLHLRSKAFPSLLITLSLLAPTTLSRPSPQSPPPQSSALKVLDAWTGQWTTHGKLYDTPLSHAGEITITMTCAWSAYGGYMICDHLFTGPSKAQRPLDLHLQRIRKILQVLRIRPLGHTSRHTANHRRPHLELRHRRRTKRQENPHQNHQRLLQARPRHLEHKIHRRRRRPLDPNERRHRHPHQIIAQAARHPLNAAPPLTQCSRAPQYPCYILRQVLPLKSYKRLATQYRIPCVHFPWEALVRRKPFSIFVHQRAKKLIQARQALPPVLSSLAIILFCAFLAACGSGSGGVSTISVTPAQPSVSVSGSVNFTASLLRSTGQPAGNVTFTWSSSATNIATIDTSGIAHALLPEPPKSQLPPTASPAPPSPSPSLPDSFPLALYPDPSKSAPQRRSTTAQF